MLIIKYRLRNPSGGFADEDATLAPHARRIVRCNRSAGSHERRSGHHSYNVVSNHYPSSGTLWRLCVGAITQAGNFKAVRNGTSVCAENRNYHYACFLREPYSNGVVWWNASGPTGAYHTLNGWATTTGAGC